MIPCDPEGTGSAWEKILTGDGRIVVAGGQENMTLAQHATYLRAVQKIGAISLVDTALNDGLWDVFNGSLLEQEAEDRKDIGHVH